MIRRTIRNLLILSAAFFVCAQFVAPAWATNAFTVQHIRIQGLHGLSKSTVLNYMPVSVGDRFNNAKSAQTIKALFGSGFFTNVRLAQQGNTLIVKVSERATIASVHINGNKAIKKDEMKKMLRNANITVGNVYNRNAIKELQEGLQVYYYHFGYYGAHVHIETRTLKRNRIAITVNISEGDIAKVQVIRFIGNHAFSDRILLKQFTITTPKIWSIVTKGDQYAKQKLDMSLQNITTFYQDHGYIHFKIISHQVSLSPDRQNVYITIHIHEGAQYHFSGFTITGKTILPEHQLAQLVTIAPGDVFSITHVKVSNKALAFALGDKGYAFARVEPFPSIDEHHKTVSINFHIKPGSQVYVRRIMFKGNTVTADYVLRRSLIQMEGGLLSLRKIQESVRQLRLLQFFKNIHVRTVHVPGTNNQVDVIYDVTEAPAGQAKASLGYGTEGFNIGAGITQPNFLGTGKTVGVNFDRSEYVTSYSISYFNPYTTLNNIGRGISLFYTKTTPGKLNIAGGNYSFDSYGFAVTYSVPLTLHLGYGFGFGLSHIKLNATTCSAADIAAKKCPLSKEVQNFITKNGKDFIEPTLNASIGYSTINGGVFPTSGLSTSLVGELSVPVSNKTLRYYKVGMNAKYYHPLNHSQSFVFLLRGGAAYGGGYGQTKGLPFFMNYYAGGISQGLVRGFTQNTLGPQDSRRNPLGGNMLVHAGASLIFPTHISPDTLRTSLFFDVGNVYQSKSALKSFSAGSLRYSVGLGVQWHSPIGPLIFSIAKPLNKHNWNGVGPGAASDQTTSFQFQMGTSF